MPIQITPDLQENITNFEELFSDSEDIKKRKIKVGKNLESECYIAYVEVAISNVDWKDSAVGKLLEKLRTLPESQLAGYVRDNFYDISDAKPFETIEDAAQAMLTGDAIFFFFFSESVKLNTALIRKRLRSPHVKVRETFVGRRTNTNVDLVYIKDLIHPEILEQIEKRLQEFEIDGALDSGIIEQLTERRKYSPFPQFQTTQRPDRAAMAILEGRIVLLSDNSPVALILPTTYNTFIQTSDDYYSRWEIASFTRVLRYVASFLAMVLPGLYLAVTNFHTQILPTDLMLSLAAARQGVPFPAMVEVLIMELAFELLREAGVRLPGANGNTIGIVGGLIIGQAAVDANIVSPIVVIVVALTALCSFAVPNEEFATAFRILKFIFIFLCGSLGFFGFLVGLLTVLIHLSHLESFGIPYLAPFVGADLNGYQDERDTFLRLPLDFLKKRPVYTRQGARIRLKFSGEEKRNGEGK